MTVLTLPHPMPSIIAYLSNSEPVWEAAQPRFTPGFAPGRCSCLCLSRGIKIKALLTLFQANPLLPWAGEQEASLSFLALVFVL